MHPIDLKASTFKKTIVSFVAAFLLSFASFGQAEEVSRDSVLLMLALDDRSEEHIDDLNKLASKIFRTYPDLSDELTQKSLEIATSLDYAAGMARAHRILCSITREKGDYESAFQHIISAISLYEKIGNMKGVASARISLGTIHFNLANYEEALKNYQIGYRLQTNPSNQARSLVNIGIAFMNMDPSDSALFYFTEAETLSREINDSYSLGSALANKAEYYMIKSDSVEALKTFYEVIPAKEVIGDYYGLAHIHLGIGKILYGQREFSKAERHLLHAKAYADSIDNQRWKSDVNETLYQMEELRGNYKKALEYHKAYFDEELALIKNLKEAQIERVQVEQELQLKKQQVALARKDQIIRNIIISFLLLLVAIAILLFKRRIQRINRDRLANEKALKDEIEQKNRELTSYTVGIATKNSFLADLLETIDDLKKNTSVGTLNKISTRIKANLNSKEDWEEFKMRFTQVHPKLYERLTERYQLTGNDLKLCAFIRLNFDIKETANLLGISSDSVKTSRYRLRRKLGMPTSENLLDFLIRIESEE